jgi:hypothetical protein
MLKLMKTLGAVVVIGVLIAALPGCEKKEGPAEKAGKSLDNAVEKTGDQMKKTGEDIKDATKGDKQ